MSQTITDINHVVSSFIGWFVLIGFSRGTTIFITDLSRLFCASSVEIGLLYTGTLIGVALGLQRVACGFHTISCYFVYFGLSIPTNNCFGMIVRNVFPKARPRPARGSRVGGHWTQLATVHSAAFGSRIDVQRVSHLLVKRRCHQKENVTSGFVD